MNYETTDTLKITGVALAAVVAISACALKAINIFTNSNIKGYQKNLMLNHNFTAEQVGNCETTSFLPKEGFKTLTRVGRLSDSMNITKAHPDWNAARISTTLTTLRK